MYFVIKFLHSFWKGMSLDIVSITTILKSIESMLKTPYK